MTVAPMAGQSNSAACPRGPVPREDGRKVTTLRELFGGHGGHAEHELDLKATVSVERLALYFSRPSIAGEFPPIFPWEGLSTPTTREYQPRPDSRVEELRDRYLACLKRCVGDAEQVAVLFSGGLDSAAVLWHSHELCLREGRRLTAVVIDLQGDDGASSFAYAMSTIRALGLSTRVVRIDTAAPAAGEIGPDQLSWSPLGPTQSAMPAILEQAMGRAVETGADVLLTGDGSDELLALPRFMLASLRPSGGRAIYRYLRDIWEAVGPVAITLEAMAVVSSLLPRRADVRLYLAATHPELCDLRPSPALAPGWRDHVTDWTQRWLWALVGDHLRAGRSWAQADAHDAFFPYDGFESATALAPLPVRAPFLEDELIGFALGLPLHVRYEHTLPSEYLRRKALAASLLPSASHQWLPRHKQLFQRSMTRYFAETLPELDYSVAIGLIDPDLAPATITAPDLHRLAAVERWLRGASANGARLEPAAPPEG